MHSCIALCGRGAVVGGHRGTGARQHADHDNDGRGAADARRAWPLRLVVADVDRQPGAHMRPQKLHSNSGPKSWFPTFATLSL